MTQKSSPTLVRTGVKGLDDILGGGLPPNRVYLVEGNPGAGKTTLALRFLIEGIELQERAMYITLSETKKELLAVAESYGFNLAGIEILELVASEDELDPDNQFAMYQPSETELGKTTQLILQKIEELKPARVVIDSLSEVRLLAQNSLRYRRQILSLKQFFAGRNCTVLFLDDKTSDSNDLQLQSIAHGVISLEQLSPEYGAERRRLRIAKLRGRRYRGGYHDFVIREGGLVVFPRLIAAEYAEHGNQTERLSSGIADLDDLVGGGIDFGTSILLTGPAGSGKSSLAVHYAVSAARQGINAAVFIFDERRETLLNRSAGLGMDLQPFLDNGRIKVQQIDPAELSPGEFSQLVKGAVEEQQSRVLIIDSLNGYLSAMPEERFLIVQLHELLTYLSHQGVLSILVVAQHGLLGAMHGPVDTTYLADTVILLRYFEARGRIRQAISVVKKRTGSHERSLREFLLGADGPQVGVALHEFRGILTGTPEFEGDGRALIGDET